MSTPNLGNFGREAKGYVAEVGDATGSLLGRSADPVALATGIGDGVRAGRLDPIAMATEQHVATNTFYPASGGIATDPKRLETGNFDKVAPLKHDPEWRP